MATRTRSITVFVFEDPRQADRAVADLRESGFGDDRIGVAMRQDGGTAGTAAGTPIAGTAARTSAADTAAGTPGAGTRQASDDTTDTKADESPAAEGALAGALAGLGLGALVGLGVLSGVIPGIGPAIAGGTLGILLSNAAAGAAVTGLIGALIGAGLSEEDAKYYQDQFDAGRTVVTVDSGSRSDDAEAILRRHGGYDKATGQTSAAGTTTSAP
jgi:hypothetical protein